MEDLQTLKARLLSLPYVTKAEIVNGELTVAIDIEQDGSLCYQDLMDLVSQLTNPVVVVAGTGRADLIIGDFEIGDFKSGLTPYFERSNLNESIDVDFETLSAHKNFEQIQKLKTKGCGSKRRRKW